MKYYKQTFKIKIANFVTLTKEILPNRNKEIIKLSIL